MKKNIFTIVLTFFVSMPFLVFAAIDPVQTVRNILLNVYNIVLAFVIGVGVIFVIIAGFKFITAQGDEGKLAEARKMLLWGLIGIGIAVAAGLLKDVVIGLLPAMPEEPF